MKLSDNVTAVIIETTNDLVTTVFKLSESIKDCFNLYVNGLKTNIYYFTKTILFMCAEEQRENAMLAERLIKEGKVYPPHGNWTGFDLCASCLFTIREVKPLSAPCGWRNELISVLTPYRIQHEQHPAIIKQWTDTAVNTQFCKRIVQDQISDNIGIYIDNYGYSLYFI